jgi:hypothetical protein
MRSFRELREELLNVRISATNTSLWALGATINDRARSAINDAIGTYKYRVTEQHNSAFISSSQLVAVLPRKVKRILDIHAIASSGYDRVPMRRYRHVPTPLTNLLHINDVVKVWGTGVNATRMLEVDYEARLPRFPKEGYLTDTLGQTSVSVTGITSVVPKSDWQGPGYFELSPVGDTDMREIVRYEEVTAAGFTNLSRGVEGIQLDWGPGTRLSPVSEVPDEAIPTLIASAEASMYRFWLAHRAQYEQWTAIAGLQQLTPEDILGIVRSEEDRADRIYDHTKTVPSPGRAQRRKRPY